MDGPWLRKIVTGLSGQTSLEGKKGQKILKGGSYMGSPFYRYSNAKVAYVSVLPEEHTIYQLACN
jgi:hypothetical protein